MPYVSSQIGLRGGPCLRVRTMVGSAMGKKISRHARTPGSSLLNRIREPTGFSVVVSDQPVLLNDQVNIMLTGLREPMFQHQTVATGFHVSPLGSATPAKIRYI